ncbi:MAG: PHP domain-containing protein [Promethearchaeota archaeon]|nr:MAG: PHP domain-containing protein [Candidatus Lokiarchaeota archaeon]
MIDFHIHSSFSDGDQSPQKIMEVALRRKLSAIAITDHCDITGRFMYLRDVSKPRPLSEYIAEVRNLPPVDSLQVFLGIEISDFSANTPPPRRFSELDFILVETFPAQTPMQPVYNPIEKAIQLKREMPIPVGLAHPTIQHIEQYIEEIEKNNLFIELNMDKLIANPREQQSILQKTAEILHSAPKVKLSIGSDAHIIFIIGAVKPLWDFIIRHEFLDRLILLSVDM